jgi:2-keto-4-pentenoate hydratase/2-oxohepta-3-ene-1,7-dioic acid hydratase in catechol pathway
MRLARVKDGEREAVAILIGTGSEEPSGTGEGGSPKRRRDFWAGLARYAVLLDGIRSIPQLLSRREVVERMEELVRQLEAQQVPEGVDLGAQVRPLSELTVLAPLPHPPKIVALGRNYVEHARELGNEATEDPPLFFKPPSSIVGPGEAIVIPPESQEVHHEVELAVVIARRGVRVPAEHALDLVGGYTVLNDVTARDLQREDIQRRRPFDRAKSFDTFCPLGPAVATPGSVPNPDRLRVTLRVNGQVRQDAWTSEMILSVPRILEYVSRYMSLEPGDIIATGTPAGVGPLRPGDVVEAEIEGIGVLRNPVVAYPG